MKNALELRLVPALALALGVGAIAVTTAACNKSEAAGNAATSAPPQIVADDKGFTPSSVDVPQGKETALTFLRTTDETCAKEVVFPDLKTKTDLPLNKPTTVTIPAGPARTLTFTCGMGMFKGKVVVR